MTVYRTRVRLWLISFGLNPFTTAPLGIPELMSARGVTKVAPDLATRCYAIPTAIARGFSTLVEEEGPRDNSRSLKREGSHKKNVSLRDYAGLSCGPT